MTANISRFLNRIEQKATEVVPGALQHEKTTYLSWLVALPLKRTS